MSENNCFVYKEGRIEEHELHPCYVCGTDIRVSDAERCSLCTLLICSKCGTCGCNLPDYIVSLRNKYCCNGEHFKRGVPRMESLLAPNFALALNKCRLREEVI